MTKKSLIERAQQCLEIGKFTGHATGHPANVYRILEELLEAFPKYPAAQAANDADDDIDKVPRVPFTAVSGCLLTVREPDPKAHAEEDYCAIDYLVFEHPITHEILAQVPRTEFYDTVGNRFTYAGRPW